MIDRGHKLPLTRQAAMLGISRGSLYYSACPVAAAELAIMRRIDELHLDYPFAGSRMLRDLLRGEGIAIGATWSRQCCICVPMTVWQRRAAHSGRIWGSTIASGRIRALTGGRRITSISAASSWRRRRDIRRRCGASLRSGYALPTGRPATAIDGKDRLGIHLSGPKRCSDQAGHLCYVTQPARPGRLAEAGARSMSRVGLARVVVAKHFLARRGHAGRGCSHARSLIRSHAMPSTSGGPSRDSAAGRWEISPFARSQARSVSSTHQRGSGCARHLGPFADGRDTERRLTKFSHELYHIWYRA